MTVALNIVALHAPWDARRRFLVTQLRKRFGRIDPPHTFSVCPDTRREGFWPAARRAWLTAASRPDATHVWVVADDIHPCPDIIPALEQILTLYPDDPISLMTGRKEVFRSTMPYFLAIDALCGGGLVVPAEAARAFVPWCDKHIPHDYKHDDGRWSLFFQCRGQLIRNTVPSLVQHEGAKHSLLGHFAAWRAPAFIGFDTSALTIDWAKTGEELLISPRASSAHKDLRMLTPEYRRRCGLDNIIREDREAARAGEG